MKLKVAKVAKFDRPKADNDNGTLFCRNIYRLNCTTPNRKLLKLDGDEIEDSILYATLLYMKHVFTKSHINILCAS